MANQMVLSTTGIISAYGTLSFLKSNPPKELSLEFATPPTGGNFGGSQFVGVLSEFCSQHSRTSVVMQAVPHLQLLGSKIEAEQHEGIRLGALHTGPLAASKPMVDSRK